MLQVAAIDVVYETTRQTSVASRKSRATDVVKGPIKRACRSNKGGKPTKWLDTDQQQDGCDDDDLTVVLHGPTNYSSYSCGVGLEWETV